MARIRSVHPGLFTDEAFMSLSPYARIFLIGLWTECDDGGIFEWKPLTLKARILPVDNVDAAELLAELEAARVLKQFEMGKQFGAIRNFRKFQRPKKPNEVHPTNDEIRTYVGLSLDVSPPVPHQFPTEGEKSPQMEDGGGRMEDVKEDTDLKVRGDPDEIVGTPSPPLPIEDAVYNYNLLAEECHLPKLVHFTEPRRKKLRARLKEVGLSGWNEALHNVAASDFLRGANGRNWSVTFDWLLSPTNLAKVRENTYANERSQANGRYGH